MNVLDRLNEDARKEFWASLALRYCDGMTVRLLAKILRHYQSAYAAYEQLASRNLMNATDSFLNKVPQTVRSALKKERWRDDSLKEWQDAQKTDCEVILWTDYRYPLALKYLVDSPVFLYAKGNIGLLSYPALAVVGSRKSHIDNLKKAEQFAYELSSLGLCIVSGMALGIDQAAHRGAIQGQGKTIAVLGTGINVVYPRQHEALYRQIAENGLILSEFSPFTEPLSQNFPVRNRLITGISEGVLIVEAALKSGSLITARLALEQNKNVYVCKPLYEMHSLGVQKLLEDGALLVEDSQTLIADLVPHLMRQYEQFAEKQEKTQAISDDEEVKKEYTAIAEMSETAFLQAGEEKKAMRDAEYAVKQKSQSGPGLQAFEKKKSITENISSAAHGDVQNILSKNTAVAEQETAVYAGHIGSLIKNEEYAFKKLLARPALNDNLEPLALDFGAMAQEILHKKSIRKNTVGAVQEKFCTKKAEAKIAKRKSDSSKNNSFLSKRKNSEYSAIVSKEDFVYGNMGSSENKGIESLSLTGTACFAAESDEPLIKNADSMVLSLLQQNESLSADEILHNLHTLGVETNMTALSAELLLLEVDGVIEKIAGARYKVCND